MGTFKLLGQTYMYTILQGGRRGNHWTSISFREISNNLILCYRNNYEHLASLQTPGIKTDCLYLSVFNQNKDNELLVPQHMAFPFSWCELYVDTAHRCFSPLFWTMLTDKMREHALQSQNSGTALWGPLPLRSGISGKCFGTQTYRNFPDRLFCLALL